MASLTNILARAKQRALDKGLDYEGALTPEEAWEILQSAPNAKLIDVRSRPELDLVGRIPQAEHIEWSFYPEWKPNPDFGSQLKTQIDPESLVMFICRSGNRSDKAAHAAHQMGYTSAYNVLEGFEGDPDPDTTQRGKLNGWKAAGLPWKSV